LDIVHRFNVYLCGATAFQRPNVSACGEVKAMDRGVGGHGSYSDGPISKVSRYH